jgi:hypothetical protein
MYRVLCSLCLGVFIVIIMLGLYRVYIGFVSGLCQVSVGLLLAGSFQAPVGEKARFIVSDFNDLGHIQ